MTRACTCTEREALDYILSQPELTEFAQQVPSVDFPTVTTRIFSVWNFFKQKHIDISKPCSGNDEAGCWLLEHLTPCNTILHPVDVQLSESKPGLLKFSPTGSWGHTRSEVALLDSLFLVCWLPKKHPCIQAIDLYETRLFVQFPTALRLALAYSSNIKSVTAGGSYSTTHQHHNTFLEGIRPDHLEHFEARYLKFDIESATRLSEVFVCASQLKSVVLDESGLSKKGMKLVLKSLQLCAELTSLEIKDGSLKEDSATYLGTIIRCRKKLKDFALYRVPPVSLQVVAKALKENTSIENLKIGKSDEIARAMPYLADALNVDSTIKTLELNNVCLGDCEAGLLAQVLRVNTTLRKVQLQEDKLTDSGARLLAEALETNHTLQDLDLALNNLSEATVIQFARTLALNASLDMVHLGYVNFSGEFDEELVQILRGHECCRRMHMEWNTAMLNELARIILLDRHDIKKACASSAADTPVMQILSALHSNSHITEVWLEVDEVLDIVTTTSLVQFFQNTKSLKSFCWKSPIAEDTDVAGVIRGMRNNDTLTRCEFFSLDFNVEVAEALSNTLEVNTTLYALIIKYAYFHEGAMKVFAKHFDRNYTLSQLQMNYPDDQTPGLYKVLEVQRRNQQLVNRATRFVLDICRDCDCREAFRILQKCDSVVQQVKCVTEGTEDDARKLVDAAKWVL